MTKKTKNLLYGKLKGGFPGLAAVLLLSCSLMFVSCGEDDDESGGGGGGIGTEIASEFRGTGFSGGFSTVDGVTASYSGTDFEVTSSAVKQGDDDIITGLKTGNGGDIQGMKYAYIYKGDKKIGLAMVMGTPALYFGKTLVDSGADSFKEYGITIDTSDMSADYYGSLSKQ